MNKLGLYIHIPFCKRICSYCDFCKRVSSKENIDNYIDMLIEEINLRQKLGFDYKKVTSIYIGGGTPSMLNFKNLERLFNKIKEVVDFNNILEFTVEANPEDLNEDLCNLFYSSSVNRVSIGLQSLNPDILKTMNRFIDYEKFLKNYQYLIKLIPNVNLDLMYAVPGQTLADLFDTIDTVLKLNPKHLSVYSLILEEKTALYEKVKNKEINLIDEDTELKMVNLISEKLKDYHHYEVSNYSLDGYESMHNLLYWDNAEYLGIGLGAASYLNHERFNNTKDFKKYLNEIANLKLPIENVEVLSSFEEKKYHIILGFRKLDGINLDEYFARYKTNIYDDFPQLLEFLKDGYFEEFNGCVKIKNKYLYVMNYLLERII